MHVSPLLVLHGSAGGVALLAGIAAMVVRKGSPVHTRTGNVFTVSMLILAASGVVLSLIKSQTGNLFGGVLTLYLVATAWTAGRSANGRSGIFDWIALAVGLTSAIAVIWYGLLVASGKIDSGVPAGMDFFLGGVLLLAVLGDARMLYRGSIIGRARIVRHLWRMSFALFEASGSFFMGRARLFPLPIQRSGILLFLTVLPLLLLVFWAIRVRSSPRWRQALPRCERPDTIPTEQGETSWADV